MKLKLVFFIFLLLTFSVPALAPDDYSHDNTEGSFWIDDVNDPPIPIDWYNGSQILPNGKDVTFYMIVKDVDNASDELSVYLVMLCTDSEYEFRILLNYVKYLGNSTYHYQYTLTGKYDTYCDFIYLISDGFNDVRVPNQVGEFYNVQWSSAVGVVGREEIRVVERDYYVFAYAVTTVFFMGLFMVIMWRRRIFNGLMTIASSMTGTIEQASNVKIEFIKKD